MIESVFNPLSINPTKLFECVWPFCEIGAERVNKVKLATLLKKDSNITFFIWIFQNYWGQRFYKTPPGDCFWMLPPGKILIIPGIDSILMDLLMGCRNFILKRFIEERRNSLKFSEIFALLSMIWFLCLIIFGKVINLLLTFVICMIFFHALFMSFCPWTK